MAKTSTSRKPLGQKHMPLKSDTRLKNEKPTDVINHLQAEDRLATVLDSLTDHAVLTLDVDGRITSWNVGAEKIKGYNTREAIGLNFETFYLPDERASGVPSQVLRLAFKHGRHEAEGWRVRKDGTTFWANVVIQPLYGTAGKLIGFVKVTRDVSQRIQVESLREQLNNAQIVNLAKGLSDILEVEFERIKDLVISRVSGGY